MSVWRRIRWWMSKGLRPERTRIEVDEDIRAHIELHAEDLRAQGFTPADALAHAETRFGNADAVRGAVLREVPDVAFTGALERLIGGLRHGARSARRAPGATALTVGTLGAAVALGTVTTAIAHSALFGDAGVDEVDRVVSVFSFYEGLPEGMREQPIHPTMFAPLADSDAVDAAAAFKSSAMILTGRGRPRRVDALLVTPDLFRVAGVTPALGPGFAPDADRSKVVVLSWSLWRDAFGADPAILGSSVDLSDEPHEVVGVMPADFAFPRSEDVPPSFRFASRPDVWVPYALPERGPSDMAMVARLAGGAPLAALEAHLAALRASMSERMGGVPFHFEVRPIREQAVGPMRPAIVLVLLATGLVVAIALGNLAGVGIVRSEARARELAVRAALGAGRAHAVGVVVGDGVFQSILAVGMGVGSGALLVRGVRAAVPAGVPGVQEATVRGLPMAVALMVGILGAAALAAGPWLRSRGSGADRLLGQGTRGASSRWARVAGRSVVAVELGMTLVLVSSGLVLYATVSNLLAVDVGFDAEPVLTAEVTLPEGSYPDVERMQRVQRAQGPGTVEAAVPAFYARLLDDLRRRPGVAAAGTGMPLPFSGAQEASVYWIEGMDPVEDTPLAEYTVVSDGYVEALGIEVLEGRAFTSDDRFDGEPVAMVSASLARRFPGGGAVGRRMKLGGAPDSPYPWLTVVGVVDDVRRTDLVQTPRGEMYVPLSQGGYTPMSTMRILVRAADGIRPVQLASTLRTAVAELDSDLPVEGIVAMRDLVEGAAGQARFTARMVVAFALVALLITALGLYSVVSYAVSARARELAIRAAMGGSPAHVARAVAGDATISVLWGLGLAAAGLVASQALLRGLVFGVAPLDPMAVGGALLVLGVTMVAALVGPLARARRLELVRLLGD